MNEKLELVNSDEYDDPILYDLENNAYIEDVKLLRKWAADTEGVIIDLACGTGRATIPLARVGHNMIGVDLHSGMLHEAKQKTTNTSLQVEWIEQDCTKLDLGVKSDFIFSIGNSFQHFLTNVAQDNLFCL
ncbi:class I SAM-dependent methyltransferase [Evansella sp. AB-P1]|uniref:class I SAM-dependent methyltransferase n=1 Tax=Evansella sp. AB-P1 TaxID=3037653 RepID=UPI00325BF637